MKKIYIIVNKYPNYLEPNVCVFIQQLVWSFADKGYNCKIICPLPVNLNIKYFGFKYKMYEKTDNGINIVKFYPKYISMGQKGKFFQKLRIKFTTWQYTTAVNRVLKREKINNKSDILYSHFICPSGVATAILAKKYHIKAFMAHGEAVYPGNIKYTNKYLKKVFSYLTGVIAVSSQNKKFLTDPGVVSANRIGIFPNGYRKERFYRLDKKIARKKFGWNDEDFIVGFCGSFDSRKGILRLEKAIDDIDDNNSILFACAGKGKLIPTSKKCIFKSAVKNADLVYFYNAIDIFALPTEREGCCNAIVEAMACGCPIISSNRSFNYDILDNENAILINPDDVDELKNAIMELFLNKSKLKQLSTGSLKKAKELTLDKRADKILKFMYKK